MKRKRGFSLLEVITVAGLSIIVASLVGSLYFNLSRVIEVERERSKLAADSLEVLRYLKRDIRQARAASLAQGKLQLKTAEGPVVYASRPRGIARRTAKGTRMLGGEGIVVSFTIPQADIVEVKLSGTREARSRSLSVERNTTIARRIK